LIVLPLIVRLAIAYPLISTIYRESFPAMVDLKLEQFKSRKRVCSAEDF